MYNRYIPQPDGSYRKNRVPDPAPGQRPQPPRRSPHSEPSLQHKPDNTPPKKEQPCEPPVHKQARHSPEETRHSDAGDFLRQLLPRDLDTGDLLIIILLLLMAGDCKEEKNTALLTLALYFFL